MLACPRNVVSAFALTHRRDHQACEGVAALVQTDRLYPCRVPIGEGTPSHGTCREGTVGSGSYDEAGAAASDLPVLNEEVAKVRGDRNAPSGRASLWLDEDVVVVVPGATHVDDAASEVDVLPPQPRDLTSAQSGVDRAPPKCAIRDAQRSDQPLGLDRRGDAVAPTTHRREAKADRRVDVDELLFALYPDAHRKDAEAIRNFFRAHTSGGEQVQAKLVQTFQVLTEFADFDTPSTGDASTVKGAATKSTEREVEIPAVVLPAVAAGLTTLNVNIQLQLPATADGEVYEKLFGAMRKHLMGLTEPS
jgi:hypothetical protein